MAEYNDLPWVGVECRKYTDAEIDQMPFPIAKLIARSHNRYLAKCEQGLSENFWPQEQN